MNQKLILAAALLICAGSAASTQASVRIPQAPSKLNPIGANRIPPPTCPYNDPRGCGILD